MPFALRKKGTEDGIRITEDKVKHKFGIHEWLFVFQMIKIIYDIFVLIGFRTRDNLNTFRALRHGEKEFVCIILMITLGIASITCIISIKSLLTNFNQEEIWYGLASIMLGFLMLVLSFCWMIKQL